MRVFNLSIIVPKSVPVDTATVEREIHMRKVRRLWAPGDRPKPGG
jgi:hypothetical protein